MIRLSLIILVVSRIMGLKTHRRFIQRSCTRAWRATRDTPRSCDQ